MARSRHGLKQLPIGPATVEDRVRSQFSPSEMYVRKSSTGTGFSPSISVYPRQYHSTNASHSWKIAIFFIRRHFLGYDAIFIDNLLSTLRKTLLSPSTGQLKTKTLLQAFKYREDRRIKLL
jgi:hypothetical protein